jgi:hypothetical protein
MLPRGVAALQRCGLNAAFRGIVTSAVLPGPFFDDVQSNAHLSQQSHPSHRTCNLNTPEEDNLRRGLASSPPAVMPSFPQFNPLRLRSYVFRLPLCTRLLLTAMVGLWVATIPFKGLRDFASLEPDKVNLGTSKWDLSYLVLGFREETTFREKMNLNTKVTFRLEYGVTWL